MARNGSDGSDHSNDKRSKGTSSKDREVEKSRKLYHGKLDNEGIIVDLEAYRKGSTPLDQAITWLAMLRGSELTVKDHAAFAEWLHHDLLNKDAFDEATLLWHRLAELPSTTTPPIVSKNPATKTNSNTDRPRPLQVGRTEVAPIPVEITGTLYSPFKPLAAAATLLLACAFFIVQMAVPTYSTGQGEQHRVVLLDGSTAFLNTNSEIRVDYSSKTRSIELVSGEVWFDVVANANRPFVVSGLHASAEAVGTAFVVRQFPNRTYIGVSAGTVAIHPIEGVSSKNLSLRAGEQVHVFKSNTGIDLHADVFDVQTALSWRQGQLVYQNTRLEDLLQDLNRYLPKTMVVNDTTLAETRVSAVLNLTDQAAMLDALATSLPMKWSSVSDNLVIVTKNSAQ